MDSRHMGALVGGSPRSVRGFAVVIACQHERVGSGRTYVLVMSTLTCRRKAMKEYVPVLRRRVQNFRLLLLRFF
jgi:hypothetical protein